MDPEEVKSLDSSGAGEKSENNSSNSDIVHVEKEEVPEEAFPGAAAPLLTQVPTVEAPEMMRAEKTSPTPSVFVELGEEELEGNDWAKGAKRGELGPGEQRRTDGGCPNVASESCPPFPPGGWEVIGRPQSRADTI